MTTLNDAFNDLIEKQKELQKQFQETAQALFKETTKEFFDKNPGITAIKWTQYTPYWNDGDTCEFGVNDPTFTNATGDDLDEVSPYGEYEGENEDVWATESIEYVFNNKGNHYDKEKNLILSGPTIDVESCKLFDKMIRSSEMEDVMLAMFGNHVVVTATRDGFEVEEYDHE